MANAKQQQQQQQPVISLEEMIRTAVSSETAGVAKQVSDLRVEIAQLGISAKREMAAGTKRSEEANAAALAGISRQIKKASKKAKAPSWESSAEAFFADASLEDLTKARKAAQAAEWDKRGALEKATHVAINYVLPAAVCVSAGYAAATYMNGGAEESAQISDGNVPDMHLVG